MLKKFRWNIWDVLQQQQQIAIRMVNSLIFWQAVCLLCLVMAGCNNLLQQIQNTRQLVALYQEKLAVLMEMASLQNISLQQIDANSNGISQSHQNNNNDLNPFNKSMYASSIFKMEEQVLFQTDFQLAQKSFYMGSGLILNGSHVFDINTLKNKVQIPGDVICVQMLQITTKIDDQHILVTKIGQKSTQNKMKIGVMNKQGKWHHATQFQDIFLQHEQNILYLSSQRQTRTFSFKSEIVAIFQIHQYKILFVCRYSYGYLNPKSLEISGQVLFQSIVQSAFYSSYEGLIFILFNDRALHIYGQDKLISKNIIAGVGKNRNNFQYVGNNFIFLTNNHDLCFDVYQIAPPLYTLLHFKQICMPIKASKDSMQTFKYKFFKSQDTYKLLFTQINKESKLYKLNLAQKQVVSERSFPWKLFLIALSILTVVYFKSSRSKKQEETNNEYQRPKSIRKIKQEKELMRQKQRMNSNENSIKNMSRLADPAGNISQSEEYLKNVNDQLKRSKNFKSSQESKKIS